MPPGHLSLKAWFLSLRAYSFTASLMPAALAVAISLQKALDIVWWTLPLYVVAALLFHAGTNVLNDYYDHVHGVDRAEDPDPTHAISRGIVTPRFMHLSGHLYFAAGIVIGSIIGFERGWLYVVSGIIGALGGYFYTGARFSFKYVALGDVAVFLLMGPVLVAMGVWGLAGHASIEVGFVSIPMALLVTAILHGNNLRDREGDRAAGVRTLANQVDEAAATWLFVALVALAYLVLVALVAARVLPVLALATLATGPVAVRLVKRVLRASRGTGLMDLPVDCAKLHLLFSLFYVITISAAAAL